MTPGARQRVLTAYLFLAPALIVLALFTFYPVVYGVWLAFCDYDMLRHTPEGHLDPPRFVGLANFAEISRDPYFFTALRNSLTYLLVVPVIQIAAMVLAVLVNQPLRGVAWFRAAYYLPVVTSVVVVGIAWSWVYQSDGLLNQVLGLFGVPPVGWLTDRRFALPAVMFVTVWQGLGYFMVLYLAGLQAIPPEYEEAARLDGASPWMVFRRITVPLMRPTVALCTIISCISAFKVFTEIFVMTRGGPEHATLTLGYYIFETAFGESYRMGYAAALALVLGLFVGVISYVNVRYFREGGLSYY